MSTRHHVGRGNAVACRRKLFFTGFLSVSVACGGNTEDSPALGDGRGSPSAVPDAGSADEGGSSDEGDAGGIDGNATPGAGGGQAEGDRAGGVQAGAGQAGTGEGTQAGGGTTGDAGQGGAGNINSNCQSASPAVAPLRRLGIFEYNNTVRDLLGDHSSPADALPPELVSLDAADDYASFVLVESYHELAHGFALRISEDGAALEALLGCGPADEGEDACRARLLEGLLPRMFRRPLTGEDLADFERVFDRGRELGGDSASGVRAVLEVALQSPEFLYLLEFGEAVPERGDAWARPTPHELAARLSYLYWGSAPDSELLRAAAEGELTTQEELDAQATRLLDNERSRDTVRRFYARHFSLLQVSPLAGSEDYPGFTEEIAELMLQETERFIDSVTWEAPGDFETLLTASYSFVNEPLSAFYGIDGVAGTEFQRVELDPAQRAGILTQPSLLASQSYSPSTNPARRGARVVRQVLCLEIPSEPSIFPDEPEPDLPLPPTTRERYEQHSEDPECVGCHRHMDPVGFAFGNYDAAGLWQDTENGYAIDASGEIYETDAAGSFVGAVELARRLAQSDDARRCYVQNWMEFAYRRGSATEDVCTRPFLDDVFFSSDGNVRELLLALSQTEAFLYRPKSEGTP